MRLVGVDGSENLRRRQSGSHPQSGEARPDLASVTYGLTPTGGTTAGEAHELVRAHPATTVGRSTRTVDPTGERGRLIGGCVP